MSNQYSSSCASADYRIGTKVKLHEVKIIWTIENFKYHEAKGKNLISPVFSAIDDNQTKWILEIKPNGEPGAKDHISFYVHLSSDSVRKEAFADFSAWFLDKDLEETATFESTGTVEKFVAGVEGWGWTDFQKKDENFKNNLLVDDELTIKCVITYSVPDVINNTVRECHNTLLYPDVAECNLSGYFGLLLENHNLADVVLSVKGKEYPAHKLILAARSPVFAAMFQHNAKENEENRVCIDDMDEEVVNEMLRYIYTGKCEKLPELAYGLLAAGDKYDLSHLKMICAEELYKNLSVENAASILALADMHNVKELKNKTVKFIASATEVLNTEGWKNIKSVELLHEVCLALVQ